MAEAFGLFKVSAANVARVLEVFLVFLLMVHFLCV
jgi:hypothetical protein